MTACATETAGGDRRAAGHTEFTVAADGSYAARLATSPEGGGRYPERWTLDGPEPYAVPLPGPHPEAAGSAVLPLADGRVLIARPAAGHHLLALLYPTGPATGELFLGAVESEHLALLPPAPCGMRAYALVPDAHTTAVWLVADGAAGCTPPQRVAVVPGRCSGGAWLDREGRLLALDRTDAAGGGRTKTVAVDLARGGEVTPLLQITEDSDDRLLLADPDSGLLLVRSDAPGEERLGWGVLGSHRPIRFPEVLRPPEGALLTPFAVQPGQMLLPEGCAVALCGRPADGGADGDGAFAEPWLEVWRPAQRELRRFRAPHGWLAGTGVWTREGELRLPCATPQSPCGLARLRIPGAPQDPVPEDAWREEGQRAGEGAAEVGGPGPAHAGTEPDRGPLGLGLGPPPEHEPEPGPGPGTPDAGDPSPPLPPEQTPRTQAPGPCKPVPLQQAPLQQAPWGPAPEPAREGIPEEVREEGRGPRTAEVTNVSPAPQAGPADAELTAGAGAGELAIRTG